jgi:hypothetical protein
VDLVVSSGPAAVTMPHVVGMRENAAAQQLLARGLSPVITGEFSSTLPRGQVISQDPAAGSIVTPGPVALTASVGPGLVLRLRRGITTADQPIPFSVAAHDLIHAEFPAPPLNFSVAPAITPFFGTLPSIAGNQIVPGPDTAGAFRLTATDPATGRRVSADFAVTAPRTPGQASMTDAYGDMSEAIGEIHSLLAQARVALALDDSSAVRTLLSQMVQRWRSVDTFRLRFATPFGLPQGFLPTAADLPSLGLSPTPDDLLAGQVLKDAIDDLTAWIDGLREPSTSMATLEALARQFNNRAARMQRLTLSQWGGIAHAPAMTVLVSRLMPAFYDALFDDLAEVVANSAGGGGPSTLAEQLATAAVKHVIDQIAETPLHEIRENAMKQAAWTASAIAAAGLFRTHNPAGSLTAIVSGASLSVRVFKPGPSFIEGDLDADNPANAVVVMIGPNTESKLSMPVDSIKGVLSAAGNAGIIFHTMNQIYSSLKQGATSPADAFGLASRSFQSPREGYKGCIFSSSPTCTQLVFPDGFEPVYEYDPAESFGNTFIGLPVPILVMAYDKTSGRITIDTPVFLPAAK